MFEAMTHKNLGADHNKEKKKKKKKNCHGDPKTLILKLGNHKHRIPINLDPPAKPEPVPEPVPPPRPASDASSALPWNLRDRNRIFRPKKLVVETKTTSTPNTARNHKLVVSLSESEIVEDFLKMTGKMPPSKPKKRVRAIQQNIDMMNFGDDLAEISSDRYHVYEPFPTQNKMRKKICGKKRLP